jgi:putative FmdB family regulatory protein
MPMFKYRCRDCKEEFEELVSFDRSNDVECPTCQSHNTEKLVSTFATIGRNSTAKSSVSCGTSRGGFS